MIVGKNEALLLKGKVVVADFGRYELLYNEPMPGVAEEIIPGLVKYKVSEDELRTFLRRYAIYIPNIHPPANYTMDGTAVFVAYNQIDISRKRITRYKKLCAPGGSWVAHGNQIEWLRENCQKHVVTSLGEIFYGVDAFAFAAECI